MLGLGLPSGTLDLADSQRLTAVSALRAGDTFTLRAGQTGVPATVKIEEADTLATLAQKIRRASGFQAKVTIVTANGAQQLKIEPGSARTVIELGPGKDDKDALSVLGIPAGAVRTTVTSNGQTTPADGKGMLYGLGLSSDLNLSSKEQIAHALAVVAAAQGVVRNAYRDLVAAATPKSAQTAASAAASGPVPAYLTNQIANYQAALDRLGGGS